MSSSRFIATSCDSNGRSERWLADSAAYVTNLNQWLRDSVVVDSVARSVDITELVAAYRQVATGAQPAEGMAQVTCAQSRVFWDYGDLAAEAAVQRAHDSVEHLVGAKAFADAVARMPQSGAIEPPDYKKCLGKEPEHRKSLGSTRLDVRATRPIPPRGWPK
jgi:hypothetical protein